MSDYTPQSTIRSNQMIDEGVGGLSASLSAMTKRKQDIEDQAHKEMLEQKKIQMKSEADKEQVAHYSSKAKELMQDPAFKDRSIHMSESGFQVGGSPEADPLKMLLLGQRKAEEDRRVKEAHDRAKERAADVIGKANLPGATTAFQRLDTASPEAKKGEFKSMGGMKNLIPTMAVPLLEKLGEKTGGMVGLQKGAARERAAIEDVANIKVYDSSGKQINEQEMKRIKSAMGFNPFTPPEVLYDALREMGLTVASRGDTAVAGIRPEIRQELQDEGEVATTDPIKGWLSGKAAETPRQKLERLRKERGGN